MGVEGGEEGFGGGGGKRVCTYVFQNTSHTDTHIQKQEIVSAFVNCTQTV